MNTAPLTGIYILGMFLCYVAYFSYSTTCFSVVVMTLLFDVSWIREHRNSFPIFGLIYLEFL